MGQVPPKSLPGRAIHYTLNEWPKLIRYTQNGLVSPDNNLIENAIRPKNLDEELQKQFQAAGQAGIDKKVGRHTLRHKFATDMLENGVNIRVLKERIGHVDVNLYPRHGPMYSQAGKPAGLSLTSEFGILSLTLTPFEVLFQISRTVISYMLFAIVCQKARRLYPSSLPASRFPSCPGQRPGLLFRAASRQARNLYPLLHQRLGSGSGRAASVRMSAAASPPGAEVFQWDQSQHCTGQFGLNTARPKPFLYVQFKTDIHFTGRISTLDPPVFQRRFVKGDQDIISLYTGLFQP